MNLDTAQYGCKDVLKGKRLSAVPGQFLAENSIVIESLANKLVLFSSCSGAGLETES
jgi:hypothetical protein